MSQYLEANKYGTVPANMIQVYFNPTNMVLKNLMYLIFIQASMITLYELQVYFFLHVRCNCTEYRQIQYL